MTKDTEYENEVADWVAAELAAGSLGLIPGPAVVRRRPAYFSRDRGKDIVFDVSIEVSRRDAATPYLVHIWECKNYTHPVPVDDVEEFHAKLSQVGVNRTKGTMVTPVGFASGGVAFAESKGIGLWRFVPPGSVTLIMEDANGASAADVVRGLTTADPAAFRDFGGFYAMTTAGQFTTDMPELMRAEFAAMG